MFPKLSPIKMGSSKVTVPNMLWGVSLSNITNWRSRNLMSCWTLAPHWPTAMLQNLHQLNSYQHMWHLTKRWEHSNQHVAITMMLDSKYPEMRSPLYSGHFFGLEFIINCHSGNGMCAKSQVSAINLYSCASITCGISKLLPAHIFCSVLDIPPPL